MKCLLVFVLKDVVCCSRCLTLSDEPAVFILMQKSIFDLVSSGSDHQRSDASAAAKLGQTVLLINNFHEKNDAFACVLFALVPL